MAVQALGGAFCLADPPAGPGDKGDKAETAAPPPREIKFLLEDEPWIVKSDEFSRVLSNVELAKRYPYAAIVRGFAPLSTFADRSRDGALRPLSTVDLQLLASFDSSAASKRLGRFANGDSYQMYAAQTEIAAWYQARLISDYADRIRPPPRRHVAIIDNLHLAFGLNARDGEGMLNVDQFRQASEGVRPPLQEYAFLAGSVDDAKQLAKDFLDVYDHAFLRRAAKLAHDAKTEFAAERDKTAPRLAELERQDAAAQKELAGVEELGAAAVSDLKVKRALLKVESAGVEARLAAIGSKLEREVAGAGAHARLVELKISADIDLASLAAQRKLLDELIDGQRRLADLVSLRQKLHPLRERAEHDARGIQRCDEILADMLPFQLVDDSIVIRSVKFESPAE